MLQTSTQKVRASAAACSVFVMLVVSAVFGGSAAASPEAPKPLGPCEKDPGTYYYTGSHYLGWQVSDVYSQWIAGPGDVSLTLTETADNAIDINISGTTSGSLIIASMSSTIGVTFSQATSRTWGWSYTKHVPSGTARGVVQKRGENASITKHHISASCTNTYTYGTAIAPYADTSTSQYCISLDYWPESKWDQTSGGCRDHS